MRGQRLRLRRIAAARDGHNDCRLLPSLFSTFAHTMHTHRFASDAAARGAHSMLSHVASWAALAALIGATWQTCRATHQRRMSAKPHAKPEREQVWEDEGGQNQMPKSPPP